MAELVGPRTRAVTAVDYAGHPAEYDDLRKVTESMKDRASRMKEGLSIIADAVRR